MERLRKMTCTRYCFKPVPLLVKKLNRQLSGWSSYFNFGYSRDALREINSFVRSRMAVHRKGEHFTSTWTKWDWCICEEF